MKPIKLKIQAFSTYLEETDIDFTQLNKQGIYLISGDTGAGKTTIFDAICFALYRKTSGSSRSNDIFRCEYAPYDLPTIVELTFTIGHQEYFIHRETKYRKSGAEKEKNDYLKLPNGDDIKGAANIDKKITDILGVDVKQFRQIVMLAQGEFSRFLMANSKDRMSILRHIFHTEALDRLESELVKRSREYENKLQTKKTELDTLTRSMALEGITEYSAETSSIVEQELDKLKKENKKAQKEKEQREEKYDHLSRVINEKKVMNAKIDEYHGKQSELTKLEEKKPEIEEKRNDIIEINKASELSSEEKDVTNLHNQVLELEKALTEIADEEARLEKDKEAYRQEEKKLENYQKEKDSLREQLHDLRKEEKSSKTYQDNLLEMKKCDKKIEDHDKKINEDEDKKERLTKRVQNDNQKIEELPGLIKEKANKQAYVEKLNQRRTKIHDICTDIDALNDAQEEYTNEYSAYQESKAQVTAISQSYQTEFNRFIAGQASVLAAGLKEGEPCPVCGSVHHPQKAVSATKLLSVDEIYAFNRRVEEARNDQAQIEQTLQQKKIEKDRLVKQINAKTRELDIDAELDKEKIALMLDEIENKIKDNDYEELEEEINYRENKLKKTVAKNKEDLQALEKRLEKNREERNDVIMRKNSLASSNATIAEDFPEIAHFEDKLIIKKEKEYQKINSLIEEINNQGKHLQRIEAGILSRKKENQDNLAVKRVKYETVRKRFHAHILDKFKDIETYSYYQLRIKEKEKLEQSVKKYDMACHTLFQRLDELKKEIGGRQKEDITKLEEEFQAFRLEKQALDEQAASLKDSYEKLGKSFKTLKSVAKDYDQLLEQASRYYELAMVTKGEYSDKISFERYVLAIYFDQIIDYANVELEKLSSGRYQFIRRRVKKGNGLQGLDMEVQDFHSGTTRAVESLSGGESFVASLALAIGLSSMIQSYAGGIELNTLFIDEGFGSLDEDLLNQAIDVLLRIRDSDKVIGIISHVSELTNKIESGIIVRKGERGSQVTVKM